MERARNNSLRSLKLSNQSCRFLFFIFGERRKKEEEKGERGYGEEEED